MVTDMLRKSNLWRGLCAMFALLLCLTSFGAGLAFHREGDVNLFLGTLPPVHDLVELCVGWLVVFVTFYAAFVKTIFRRW